VSFLESLIMRDANTNAVIEVLWMLLRLLFRLRLICLSFLQGLQPLSFGLIIISHCCTYHCPAAYQIEVDLHLKLAISHFLCGDSPLKLPYSTLPSTYPCLFSHITLALCFTVAQVHAAELLGHI